MSAASYDLIIIGGGPSGLTAALYASRSQLKTLLIERMGCGGQAAITDWIENYPGFPDGINGFELANRFEQQARKFGAEVVMDTVTALSTGENNTHTVTTSSGSYTALAVIIAAGADHKKIGVPGEAEFLGRGVSYCATCDGPFFKGKEVAVVGGGDSAVQEAIYLTRFASKVTLIHRRDRLRATKILQDRARTTDKLSLSLSSTITRISGGETVDSITIKNTATGIENTLKLQGVFVFVGYTPNTDFITNKTLLDEGGYLLSDGNMKTVVPGIFAGGDVRSKMLKQVVTAAGDGAAAAFAAQEYIDELKGTAYK